MVITEQCELCLSTIFGQKISLVKLQWQVVMLRLAKRMGIGVTKKLKSPLLICFFTHVLHHSCMNAISAQHIWLSPYFFLWLSWPSVISGSSFFTGQVPFLSVTNQLRQKIDTEYYIINSWTCMSWRRFRLSDACCIKVTSVLYLQFKYTMADKTVSCDWREKGNASYRNFMDSNSSERQRSYLESALKSYHRAYETAESSQDKSSAAKNSSMAAWRLTNVLSQLSEETVLCEFRLFREAIGYFSKVPYCC